MHVLTDENGNVIHSHHTHPHTHTIEHSHEHVHEAGHEEDHTHSHEHPHEHPHDHEACEHSHGCAGSCGTCPSAEEETLALVGYMVQHNQHHAAELADMAKKLREMGKDAAAEQIEKGVSDFESGNVRLSVALSLLKADQ